MCRSIAFWRDVHPKLVHAHRMASARKIEIGKAFACAAAHYDEHAAPHAYVAKQLIDFAASDVTAAAPTILEIGCGTGILTRAIRQHWPQAIITATDIAPQMVEATRSSGIANHALLMDGEEPDLAGQQFDLILSSLAFQWFEALPAAISRLRDLLRPGGQLCFSTMGQQSFHGWRKAHDAAGLDCGMADYPALADLQTIISPLRAHQVMEEAVPLAETGGKALLRHFRAIGAHVPRAGYHRLPASVLRRLISHFDAEGGEAAYHILYAKVRNA